MPADVTGDLSAARGVTCVDCILQVQLFGEGCEIIGVSIHLVTIPRLRGTTVAPAVVRNDSIATIAEEQHLRVPVVRSERPALTEYYRLSRSPVLVENLCTIFCRNRW